MRPPPFLVDVPAGHDRWFVADCCANCLTTLSDENPQLFCSTWCRETASAVRYERRVLSNGTSDDPEIQYTLQVKRAFLLIGGYASLGRTLPTATRDQVKERAGGVCARCGNPGTDIDHIDGSSAELDNLQLLCAACHREKTSENFVPATAEERALLIALHLSRIAPDSPRLLADDEERWDQLHKTLRRERRDRFYVRAHDAGLDTRGMSRAQIAATLRETTPARGANEDSDEPDVWSFKDLVRRNTGIG